MMNHPDDSIKQNLHHRSFNPTDAIGDGSTASATASATADVVTIQPDIQQSAGPPDAAFCQTASEKHAFCQIPDAKPTKSKANDRPEPSDRKQNHLTDISTDIFTDISTDAIEEASEVPPVERTVKAVLEMARDGKPERRIIHLLACGLKSTDFGSGPVEHVQSIFRDFHDRLGDMAEMDVMDSWETFVGYWNAIDKPIRLISASDFWLALEHGIANPSALAKRLADQHFVASDDMTRLIECCITAQRIVGDGFWLSGRRGGELFDVSYDTFLRRLHRMVDSGLLEIIEPGSTHRSPRLRWTGPTGAGPEPVRPSTPAAPAPAQRPPAKRQATSKPASQRADGPRTMAQLRQRPSWNNETVMFLYQRMGEQELGKRWQAMSERAKVQWMLDKRKGKKSS